MTDSPKTLQRRNFSLAELIVAMGLLSMLMFLLFRFVIQAQELWQLDESNSRIYENSRSIYNIVGRDLQYMMTSDITNRQISYTSAAVGDVDYAWVTASAIGVQDDDPSKLTEVGYSFDSANYQLTRYMSRSSQSQWNFFNQAPSTWAASSSWPSAADGGSTVLANGLQSFEITFYDSEMNEIPDGAYNSKPAMALIELELFDPDAIVGSTVIEAERERTKRSMSKMIFLTAEE